MSYEPPQGNKIAIRFSGKPYVSPEGGKIRVEFRVSATPPNAETTYIFPQGWSSDEHGELFLRSSYRVLSVEGFLNSTYGQAQVKNNARLVRPSGFNSQGFGTAYLQLGNRYLKLTGFNSLALGKPSLQGGVKYLLPTAIAPRLTFGTVKVVNTRADQFLKPSGISVPTLTNTHTVYNLRQYVRLSGQGINSVRFGTAYAQGGVKFIYPSGLSTLSTGKPSLINTRADQQVKPTGISSLVVSRPIVSPWYVIAKGFATQVFGTPSIRKHPVAKGWDSSTYGTAWVSRSPRFYTVGIGELTQFGSHKIFDAKQTVWPYAPIVGGVFGDIAIRNINFKITPISITAPQFTDWTNVENHARFYGLKGFDSSLYGTASIRNGTPSLIPKGFDNAVFGQALIADRVRRVNTPGFNLMRFGQAIVTKTPQITPNAIAPPIIGQPTLTLYTRYLEVSGHTLSAIGEPLIAMSRRSLKTSGLNFTRIGEPTLSHGVRDLLAKGSDHSRYGQAHQVWFRVRSVAPESIPEIEMQRSHMVGGTRHIEVKGFEATLFGKRITPEYQTIAPNSLSAWAFGEPNLVKTREYLGVTGFATAGTQPADRWGKTTLHNSRQYIVQTFDIDSELNPPKMQGWTAIANRNRVLGPVGSIMTLVGRPSILNKATPILPKGFDYSRFGTHFISAWVRTLRLEGIEPPYFSGWTNLHNAAAVIKPKGFATEKFGTASVTNTRRYFPRIGNFETMLFGEPMISFKIRNLTFESRYSIGPIYIPIHKVDLYTRYVEATSKDFTAFGLPALTIHKKIITPRWTLRDYFGDVGLRNVTPEVKTKGHNAEEFGTASIRTQWREVKTLGDNAQLLGKPLIAFRNRLMTVTGFNMMAIGSTLRVRGTGSPPLSTQHIYLNDVSNRDDDPDDDGTTIKDGLGIEAPAGQVPQPSTRTNVLRPTGFLATRFGESDMYSNGILMDNGIKLTKECGTPSVQLALRDVTVEGILSPIVMGKPRLSPHTIYAVTEATPQAIVNHGATGLHKINSFEVFGKPRVWTHTPYLDVRSLQSSVRFGQPRLELSRRIISVEGIRAYRFGWHNVGDGTQTVMTRAGVANSVFGKPSVALEKDKQIQVRVAGINALAIGRVTIDLLHRTIKPTGLNALGMGASRSGTLYMPQSLHVGPRMPVIPIGNVMERFGTTYIGLRVREVLVIGFDACRIEYDPLHFDKRMKVKRGEGGVQPKPIQHLIPVGFDALRTSASNVKSGVHYIRPDGNSDQFRKGGF